MWIVANEQDLCQHASARSPALVADAPLPGAGRCSGRPGPHGAGGCVTEGHRIVRTLTNNVTSKYTPNMAAYNIAFGGNNPNYAAAVAVTLAIFTFILSFGFMKLTQRGAD